MIKFNGSTIKNVKANGSVIRLIRLSGSTIYEKEIPILTGQLVAYPNGYSGSYSSTNGVTSSSNANTAANSTTRATVYAKTGSGIQTVFALTFNTSSIPANAVITNITFRFKASVSNTSRFSTVAAQMYAGSTAKGSSVSFRSTSATQRDVSIGAWTRAELENMNLRLTATRGTSSTSSSASIYVYGATLTIDYTYTE